MRVRHGRHRWWEEGDEPDYRFSLANERTFLAWIRTALAVMAGAVAIEQLVPSLHLHGARRGLGILLAVLALVVSASAYRRWAANQKAMRMGLPLPRPRFLALFAVAVTTVAVLVAVIVMLG